MDGTLGKNYLKSYILQVRPMLKDFIESERTAAKNDSFGAIPDKLLEAYEEMVAEGKGIRGALINLVYKACGGIENEKILKASTFIELFHSAILIHDDYMDRDPTRRGLISVHKRFSKIGKDMHVCIPDDHYGNSLAVCIGDSGLFYSWKVLLASGFSPEYIIKAGEIFAYYIGRLGLGQALDMTTTSAQDLDEQEALKVLLVKSAEYTSILPMKIGAALAGEIDKAKLDAIENYARCFGWAFQIQDDILGLYAEEDELGKPLGSDLREGKNTLLMIDLRKNGTHEQLDFQKNILGSAHIKASDVTKMKDVLKECGSYDRVLKLGWNYVTEGSKYIPLITSDLATQQLLESLIFYMMERTK